MTALDAVRVELREPDAVVLATRWIGEESWLLTGPAGPGPAIADSVEGPALHITVDRSGVGPAERSISLSSTLLQPHQTSAPPFDVRPLLLGSEAPDRSGANVCVQYVLLDTLIEGDVPYFQTFERGQLTQFNHGLAPAPDLRIELRYSDYLRVRLDQISIVEALEYGRLTGDVSRASVLAGLLSGRPFQDVWSATARNAAVTLDAISRFGIDAELGAAMVAHGRG